MSKILITGDFCPIGRIQNLVFNEMFQDIFNDFLPVLMEHDLNITNLECPIFDGNNPIKKTGPNLKSPEKSIKLLSYGHFGLITLANNHIMDHGINGLVNTLDVCSNNQIEYVGAGRNTEEASKTKYIVVKNQIIAIVNVAENEFNSSSDLSAGSNPLNPVMNYYQLQEAKKNADVVFLIIHGGHEMYQLPSPRMQETYRFFVDAGADVVIGHHTHCYSGYEIYKNKPIFYSLGNFIFDRYEKYTDSIWNEGYAVSFSISHKKIDFSLYPYTQGNKTPGIKLMQGKQLDAFKKNIASLNATISDSTLLKSNYHRFLDNRRQSYSSHLEPYNNRYLLALYKKGFFPSLLTNKKKRTLLNLIRCEAHRDILIETLKKNYEKNSNT